MFDTGFFPPVSRQSVTQMYEEASKMLEQPRANSPKLKGAFKSERHEVEREMWRQELEVWMILYRFLNIPKASTVASLWPNTFFLS